MLVIGNEVLNGDVRDTNIHTLAKRLSGLGVHLKRISVIPDNVDEIAFEVRQMSRRFTHVFTSGGIGPTHDDLTYEGVALAFYCGLHLHPDFVPVLRHYFNLSQVDLTSLSSDMDPRLKMAYIPTSADLIYQPDMKSEKWRRFPIVRVRNVYMLPGVPSLFEKALDIVTEAIHPQDGPFHRRHVYVNMAETTLAPTLNQLVSKFKCRGVAFGSYPQMHNSFYKVRLTIEAQSQEILDEVQRELAQSLPPDAIVTYDPQPRERAYEKIVQFAHSTRCPPEFRPKLLHSLELIEKVSRRFKSNEVFLSYNGGKDCTALLHLWHAVVRQQSQEKNASQETIRALYIRSRQPFPEVETFVEKTTDRYHLQLKRVEGLMKPSLEQYLSEVQQTQGTPLRAVLMGTRRSDPRSSHLSEESPTDEGWPPLLRVMPLLDWTYTEVWTFLRGLSIPVCSLYDQGYTSLGSMENTHPNPKLRYVDENGRVKFKPAYCLLNGNESERDGRN